MFGFGKNKKDPAQKDPARRSGVIGRLKERLARTRANLTEGLARLFAGRRAVSEEILEEVEERLLLADVGIDATMAILADLRSRMKRQALADTEVLYQALRENMLAILAPCSKPLAIPDAVRPFVILMVGVNGSGKTTTIGKLAFRVRQEGRSVLLAAGDTFRAAAVEQLKVWGERNDIPVIAQGRNADSASVIYDAFQAARARQVDLVIADTAGRLHTKSGLMEELKKVKRVLAKLDPTAPHEVLLVLDATTGQNALIQAEQFHQAIGVTGIVLSKLDGTAKGGILFAIAQRLRLPIRFIGVGEDLEDLREFDAGELIDALLGSEGESANVSPHS
ncbi:Signal recognition particle receptor FtsY [Gammaproteobacteria bacterium]